MYSYNNMPQYGENMYFRDGNSYNYPTNNNDDRFIAGGLLAPLFLGGVAGYAIGSNRPNNYYPTPYYYPQPIYYNNYYYPYY